MRKIFSQKKQMVKDNVIIYLEIEIDEKESKIYANNEIIWTEHISRYYNISENEISKERIEEKRIKEAQRVLNELTKEETHEEFKYFIGDDDIENIIRAIGSYMTFKETSEAVSSSKYDKF